MKEHQHRAIIVTVKANLLRNEGVMGTGGWLPFEEREVLDWMTLIASLGWECRIRHPDEIREDPDQLKEASWIILSNDLAVLPHDRSVELLDEFSAHTLVVIGHAEGLLRHTDSDLSFFRRRSVATGKKVSYLHNSVSREWYGRKEIICDGFASPFEGEPAVWLEDAVIGIRICSGNARYLSLSFQANAARDNEGVFSTLLKEILIAECLSPVVWLEWENTLLLRMDDPGSSQRVHHSNLDAPTLTASEWIAIGNLLQQQGACLSVGYVPTWVDDGDGTRGKLWVDGQLVDRVPGKMYPSSSIRYESFGTDNTTPQVFDYGDEFMALTELIDKGTVSAALHGYTHIFPDVKAWLRAEDKFTNASWFREFGRRATRYMEGLPDAEHPLEKGIQVFSQLFNRKPSTLIFPGEEFTPAAVHAARIRNIRLIGSYYLAMPVGGQLCWNHYICSPYLNQAEASFFDHSLPVVGYFHDFDIARNGTHWLACHLEEWVRAGARYFIDYDGLASILGSQLTLLETPEAIMVSLRGAVGAARVRLGIYLPGSGRRWELHMPAGQTTLKVNQPEWDHFSNVKAI